MAKEFDPKVVELLVRIKAKESVPSRKVVLYNVEEVIRMLFKDCKWVEQIQVMLRVP